MQKMIVDSHAHFADEKFDNVRDAILSDMLSDYVQAITEVGYDIASSERAVMLARQYEKIYAAVGIHPLYTGAGQAVEQVILEQDISAIKKLAENGKSDNSVTSIGEIGLDYYDKNLAHEDKNRQMKYFRAQLELALELDMPVIIHSIKAADDTLMTIREYYKKSGGKLTGTMHGFNYSPEIALEYVKMGFFIGVGDVITFENSRKIKEVVKKIPREKILVESDGKIDVRLVNEALNKLTQV